MRIDLTAGTGEANTVNQAGMVERIGEDDVVLGEKRRQQPQIGGVTAAEIEGVFGAGKSCEFTLDFIPNGRVSGEQTRTGAADTLCIADRFQHGLLQHRMLGEPEVVIRAKIDAWKLNERTKLVAF